MKNVIRMVQQKWKKEERKNKLESIFKLVLKRLISLIILSLYLVLI